MNAVNEALTNTKECLVDVPEFDLKRLQGYIIAMRDVLDINVSEEAE